MLTALLLLIGLVILNGLFAMAEIAVVSSRRARLQQLADEGRSGASHALALSTEPTRFLSSVQVGITSIGIMSGAIGEVALAEPLRVALATVPWLAPYADTLALAAMVVALTYVSLILGELVPKRLALTRPEAIASLVGRPMTLVAVVGRPVVQVLTLSTDTVLRLLRVRVDSQPSITGEEIKVLLEQGTEEGVFEPTERELVTNVLGLDERLVKAIVTPRADVAWLDVHDTPEQMRALFRGQGHAVLPVCDGGLDTVVGMVRASRVTAEILDGRTPDLAALSEPALFVPENTTVMRLLERFRLARLPVALVVDEFGGVEGLVSLSDVVELIVGELAESAADDSFVQREDGTWLVAGSVELESLQRRLALGPVLAETEHGHYRTLGGLAMAALGRVPRTGDVFDRAHARFEIVDMDGHRVDRVLVTPPAGRGLKPPAPHSS